MRYLALALLLLASPALGAPFTPNDVDEFGIEVPPASYTHHPDRPTLEYIYDRLTVAAICNPRAASTSSFDGCALTDPGLVGNMQADRVPEHDRQEARQAPPEVCVVVMVVFPTSKARQRALERHEFAHCNGLYHNPNSGSGWYDAQGRRVYG